MAKGTLLIVDDNRDILVALKLLLNDVFAQIITEKNPSLIPGILEKNEVDVIILDMNFRAGVNTGNEGIYWMNEILKKDPQAVIIFITAYGDVDIAVKAMKEGALDFIQKPWDDEKLLVTVRNAYTIRRSRMEIDQLKDQKKLLVDTTKEEKTMVGGSSPAMATVMKTVEKVAPTDASVLILGENGTGKELIARELYKRSLRANEVFVRVDLGSIAPTLFESELFGHVKGAFTGAIKDKPGRFEIADKGTLFLDEIGNIPPELQKKLLTALQNREINRLGSSKVIPIDIRLISATNYSMDDLVKEKEFREDLLYRINTIKIDLPPLRERKDEIALLADHFLNKYGKKYNKKNLKLNTEIIKKLSGYPWPGNIRELEHTIEKVVILHDKPALSADEFFFNKPLSFQPSGFTLNLEENEKELIRKSLLVNKGNISRAAEDLGISRKTLYNKMEKYEI
jgi:DNA-binding NtrC family response regulator